MQLLGQKAMTECIGIIIHSARITLPRSFGQLLLLRCGGDFICDVASSRTLLAAPPARAIRPYFRSAGLTADEEIVDGRLSNGTRSSYNFSASKR